MARRPGFTLVEVLATLALLAVLLAFLFPVVTRVRASAMKVVCASRLRDLTNACLQYRVRNADAFPVQLTPPRPPAPAGTGMFGGLLPVQVPTKPTEMDVSFLNQLEPFLRFPAIDPGDGPERLPHALQCPNVEDLAGREISAEITLTRPALYTGYAYIVRPKDGSLSPLVKLLKADRVAAVRASARAVVWADYVQWSVADKGYGFAHGAPGAPTGAAPYSFARPDELLGQHRAYSDGSVEWVAGQEIDVKINAQQAGAARKASISVFDLYFYWF